MKEQWKDIELKGLTKEQMEQGARVLLTLERLYGSLERAEIKLGSVIEHVKSIEHRYPEKLPKYRRVLEAIREALREMNHVDESPLGKLISGISPN